MSFFEWFFYRWKRFELVDISGFRDALRSPLVGTLSTAPTATVSKGYFGFRVETKSCELRIDFHLVPAVVGALDGPSTIDGPQLVALLAHLQSDALEALGHALVKRVPGVRLELRGGAVFFEEPGRAEAFKALSVASERSRLENLVAYADRADQAINSAHPTEDDLLALNELATRVPAVLAALREPEAGAQTTTLLEALRPHLEPLAGWPPSAERVTAAAAKLVFDAPVPEMSKMPGLPEVEDPFDDGRHAYRGAHTFRSQPGPWRLLDAEAIDEGTVLVRPEGLLFKPRVRGLIAAFRHEWNIPEGQTLWVLTRLSSVSFCLMCSGIPGLRWYPRSALRIRWYPGSGFFDVDGQPELRIFFSPTEKGVAKQEEVRAIIGS